MKLDRRLAAAASLVRPDQAVCDVGTDHGYLPVYLAEAGHTGPITACDINEAPLAAARRTIGAAALTERIRLIRSDGLKQIPPALAEDVVICGMGGELIGRIVIECPYLRQPERRLILQPMTRASELRRSLSGAGFAIQRELAVIDGHHRYTVMSVSWTGKSLPDDPLFWAVGKLPDEATDEAIAYVEGEYHRVRQIADGLAGRPGGDEAEKLARCLLDTAAQMKMRRELP